ncbi:MAG: 3-methyl-2-oxobutanoate hydroxymethyltransferase [Actinomycetota bacterium]|jgi:3-methyl-2-oxobutanoate hydroxymethyltransferase|nr:3-methyl-2-oxobutanoate hydroxymethyltransferase [Actinomycetota bacterium]
MKSTKKSVPQIRAHKADGANPPIAMVTAYDAPGARMTDAAGVDIILVGDSLAMVVLGYNDTLSVTIDDMAYHTKAVARTEPNALVVTDMPWLSYHTGVRDAVRNAAKLVRAGAEAVKLEGGANRVEVIRALVDAEIPVMGHLGLTPQSVHAFGGFSVQAKTREGAKRLLDEALEIEQAGVFSVVLEAVPQAVAAKATELLKVPTIGIGAGPNCDGQVLVFHDLLGLTFGHKPKFVRRYGSLGEVGIKALEGYVHDVKMRSFPTAEEGYQVGQGEFDDFSYGRN